MAGGIGAIAFPCKFKKMKFPWTLSLLLLAGQFFAISKTGANTTNAAISSNYYDEDYFESRLLALNLPLTIKMTPGVVAQIEEYLTTGRNETEAMMGRAEIYLPTIEFYLRAQGIPAVFKYLALVESNLKPNAVSPVGAAGLWQFMETTARSRGLTVNATVDQRRDIHQSTMAAAGYLKELHRQFGSWELALAAYNCGPGNVYKAIQAGGSSDFWAIRDYLPAQTQLYVPRFIAAVYIGTYYKDHGIKPASLGYDLQFTRTIKVFSHISFQELAAISHVDEEIIRALNPAFRQGFIPQTEKGQYLVLPAMGMMSLKDYLRWSNGTALATDIPFELLASETGSQSVVVEKGDNLKSIASKYQCSKEDLIRWNNLKNQTLYFHQELLVLPLTQRYGADRATP